MTDGDLKRGVFEPLVFPDILLEVGSHLVGIKPGSLGLLLQRIPVQLDHWDNPLAE